MPIFLKVLINPFGLNFLPKILFILYLFFKIVTLIGTSYELENMCLLVHKKLKACYNIVEINHREKSPPPDAK